MSAANLISRNTTTLASTDGASARKRVALTAALLGAILVFGVGFAPLEAAHNAAHDGRHAFALPCH